MKGKAASAQLRRTLLAVTLAGVVVGAQLPASTSGFAAARPPGQAGARTTAPVKLPPSSGEPAATQPKRLSIGEQPERRTRYSFTRYDANHTFTTTISGHPVNYRVRNGGWEPIDSTLVSTKQNGYAYQNRSNAFQTLFKNQLGDDYLGLLIDGQLVKMTLQGASKTTATAKGSTLSYQGALPHVDATYNVSGDGLEEVLTLKDRQAPTSFQFLLKPPEGTTASREPDGSWVFVLPGHAPASFALRSPIAYDSGSKSRNASQPHSQISVRQGRYGFEVMLSIDRLWLMDPSRQFPVYLDPTFTIQPDVTEAIFDNNCAGCIGAGGSRLTLGNVLNQVGPPNCTPSGCSSDSAYRAAMQFDISAIPGGATISTANLRLFWDQVCIDACDTGAQIEAHLMTAAWSPSSKTSQLQFNTKALTTFTALAASAPPQWMTFDISSTVASWVSSSLPNYGLYLLMSNDSKSNTGGPAPPGASNAPPGEAPQLVVTYGGDSIVLNQPAVLHANGAELNWTQYTGPSGAAFQKYEVHRSQSKGFTPSLTTLLTTLSDVSATSYRDTTAAPNATFYYAVVANSSKSNEVKVTLPADGQSSMTLQSGSATFIGYSTTSTKRQLWCGPKPQGGL